MRQGLRDLLFSLLMLGIGGFLWWETTKDSYQQDKMQDYGFDPAFFPRILIGLWMAMAVVILLGSFRDWAARMEGQRWGKLAGALALTSAYAAAMHVIGFLFASIPFSALMMVWLGFRRPVIVMAIAVLFPLLTWYSFVHLLNIPLPVSPWFSRM
ncbi:MAG: tripartite tricarboxylate transporter TctB family protein [Burkholderiaceae bacterium]